MFVKKIMAGALLSSMLLFLVPQAVAGPTIRQAVHGHLSMSKSRCLNIAKNICEGEANNCMFDEGAYVLEEDYSIGIQCSKLGYDITIMILFGAVGNDRSEKSFNDLFLRLYNRAIPFFR